MGTGALALSASGLLALAPATLAPRRGGGSLPPQRSFTLHAREGTVRTVDAKTLYGRGFAGDDAVLRIPGPVLSAKEGEPVRVVLINDAAQDHAIAIEGLASTGTVPPGGTGEMIFIAPHAGTFIYLDPTAAPLNRALGMYGALVVTPADGSNRAWDGGPTFLRQYLQVVSELDESWNAAAGLGQPVDTSVYRPNYFFLNGRGFPDSDTDPNGHIHGAVGETILIRWANAGLVPHSLHTHGYHFKIVQQNGTPEVGFAEKDNVPVYPGATMDVIVDFDQPGLYPIHDHILMANTGNGVYPKGIMAMFEVV